MGQGGMGRRGAPILPSQHLLETCWVFRWAWTGPLTFGGQGAGILSGSENALRFDWTEGL